MSSVKINEIQDGIRNFIEVTTLPKGTKVRQVAFTRRRMFVMSEDGKLFVYAINEIPPEPTDYFSKKRPEFTGELLLEKPLHVKEIPALKQIACGVDHILCLDRSGKVWGMGNDTFG